MERLSQLEGTLIGQADAQRERARIATNQGPAPSDHQGLLAAAGSPHGFYESALSYYEAARQVDQAARDILRALAKRAAAEHHPGHPWPIPALEYLTDTHRDTNEDHTREFRERFPRWGISSGQDGFVSVDALTIAPASVTVGGLLVRMTTGSTAETTPPDRVLYMHASWEQWDALVMLADRIRAGEPIPYDDDGNTRGPQPQQKRP
jgi:hypothetical protein